MLTRLILLLAFAALLFGGCGGDGKEGGDAAADKDAKTPEEIYSGVAEARRDLETTEEKLAVTKEFLSEHPVSVVTARALDAVLYYQGDALGDMGGAIAYAEGLRGQIEDAEIAASVDKVMIPWYAEAGMKDKMLSTADRLAAAGKLDFNDHWNVIEGAVQAEEWDLARTYCDKARPLATPEAYKSDYARREFTDDEIAEGADNRLGMITVMDGWSRANQGDVDGALTELAKADGLVRHSYVGTPEYDLDVYWAKTLMMKGDYEAAINQFARKALVMRDEQALAGLKEAYGKLRGEMSGFDQYAANLHRSVARTVQDFELTDYDGAKRRFSDLRGDVTLLTFWFPT